MVTHNQRLSAYIAWKGSFMQGHKKWVKLVLTVWIQAETLASLQCHKTGALNNLVAELDLHCRDPGSASTMGGCTATNATGATLPSCPRACCTTGTLTCSPSPPWPQTTCPPSPTAPCSASVLLTLVGFGLLIDGCLRALVVLGAMLVDNGPGVIKIFSGRCSLIGLSYVTIPLSECTGWGQLESPLDHMCYASSLVDVRDRNSGYMPGLNYDVFAHMNEKLSVCWSCRAVCTGAAAGEGAGPAAEGVQGPGCSPRLRR